MPPPPPPSVVQKITCPVFAVRWIRCPAFGMVAYGGGGGSARTGVGNTITVLALEDDGSTNDLLRVIDTSDQICVSLDLLQTAALVNVRLLAAVGHTVRVYDAVLGTLLGTQDVHNDGSNAVAFSSDGRSCAVGCENGKVLLYDLHTKPGSNCDVLFTLRHECDGHLNNTTSVKRGVCSIAFSPHNEHDNNKDNSHHRDKLVLSSARDGTARVWDFQSGKELATLQCSVVDPNAKIKKQPAKKQQQRNNRPSPILVRGCAFGHDSTVIYTCQSGRRGPALCSVWQQQQPQPPPSSSSSSSTPLSYREITRICVSPCPVSSVSMSQDRSFLAFGNVEGCVLLYKTHHHTTLTKSHTYTEVHDLPVTCLAAAPSDTDGATHGNGGTAVVSCSADNKLAFLSTDRRPMKTWVLLCHLFWLLVAVGVGHVWYGECKDEVVRYLDGRFDDGMDPVTRCMKGSLFVTQASMRPGISFVPH